MGLGTGSLFQSEFTLGGSLEGWELALILAIVAGTIQTPAIKVERDR